MSRKLTVLLALVSLALGITAATSLGAAPAKTKAKITSGGPTLFKGKVTSKSDKCIKGRKVQLMYTPGKHAGVEPTQVGSDKTDAKGIFMMPGDYFAGFYYIVVLAKQGCAAFTGSPSHY